ncbi:MAG: tail fiber domain-containing protein [Colwellia sp.]
MNRIKKYLIPAGSLLFGMLAVTNVVQADQVILDDLIVVGSICSGLDCVNGENFNFDTIRLKENNLRIKFQDTSSSSSFPNNDWQITINDSVNGGANKFSIEDIDGSRIPFTILAGSPNNSIYVSDSGNVGLGTSTPLVELNIKDGNTPALRLEQDASSGFAAQTWDVGGNETNFFIRDVTNGSKLPLRITSNAPNASIHIAADGDVGFQTTTPDGQFDVAHSSDANNHAFLIGTDSSVGVNIDNGQIPKGWFDVQTSGGISRFNVDAAGNVGIGTATPSGRFEVRNLNNNLSYFNVDANGKVGIGTNAPAAPFDMTVADASMIIKDTSVPTAADVRTLLTLDSEYASNIKFANRNLVGKEWTIGPYKTGEGFMISRVDTTDNTPADPYDNYNLLINDTFMVVRNLAGVELMKINGSQLTVNGTVVSTSSRTMKENIVAVEPQKILDSLSTLVINKWNYLTDSEGVKHIGPIAEDFYALFGLGMDEKHIASLDTSGIALAAIQALHDNVQQKDAKIEALEQQNKTLADRVAAIEAAIAKLSDSSLK